MEGTKIEGSNEYEARIEVAKQARTQARLDTKEKHPELESWEIAEIGNRAFADALGERVEIGGVYYSPRDHKNPDEKVEK